MQRNPRQTNINGNSIKKIISYLLLLLCVPTLIIIGNSVFANKKYSFISIGIAVIACAAFFLTFEYGRHSSIKLVLTAAMTALSVSGRFLFAMLPGFKPVTAIIIITALYFGAQAGFMTGALTALISNIYFGQGPWTPFQMLAWGIVGLLGGILSGYLKKNKWLLLIYSALAGILFSMIMDIWTVLWMDNSFNFTRYAAALLGSAKSTLTYAVSNVIFISVLMLPTGRALERIKEKYDI